MCPSPSRLIVAANRLPVRRHRTEDGWTWAPSPGGLVSALAPVLQERGGAWVGWTGLAGPAPSRLDVGPGCLHPVALQRSDLEGFYGGFSNRSLWPLYHDALRTPEFHRRWWRTYEQVNARFAERVAEVLQPGDVAWVHDYHLQLVPRLLRRHRPDVRIGFFLHIPFPTEELFARLPWRREVLEGLLGADLIGFQTRLDAHNFARAARRFVGGHVGPSRIRANGREVRYGDFPISVEAEEYDREARRPATRARATALRRRFGEHRRILLGVDRLDYTKGIDVRLRAIDEVFRQGRFGVEDIVFVQVAVPSRESVADYAAMRRTIEELVGRLNGDHAEPGRVAVQYLRRTLPRAELVAWYGAADVMIVTPLKDGMNLVAKEYVASRADEDGVLVLSEFTGAAHELEQAVHVNPFDVDGMATRITEALEMPAAERTRRMRALRRVVRASDVHRWARAFLGALDS